MNPHSYGSKIDNFDMKPDSVYGLPLTAMEYKSFFEVSRVWFFEVICVYFSVVSDGGLFTQSQNVIPEAEYITDSNDLHGWVSGIVLSKLPIWLLRFWYNSFDTADT